MSDILVFDHVLGDERREQIWQFLDQPGWVHGAYSGDRDKMPRYFYKHFAGYEKSSLEDRDPGAIADQLRDAAPLIHAVWEELTRKPLKGQILSRCYANAMPPGIGGGVHLDSNQRDHLTAIYYPQASWSADEGGETLFFSRSVSEVIKAVVPKPDRLVVFPGTIPHVARPVYARTDGARVTLMFKTLGRARPGTPAPRSRA